MSSIPAVNTLAPSLTVPTATHLKGAKAAREFEAQLIEPLLDSLEKTFAALPGKQTIPGADDYGYLGTQALAGILSARGGFGIALMISHQLERARK